MLLIEDMDVREDEEHRGKSDEDLIPIPLDTNDPEKITYVGESLQDPLKGKMIEFLQENSYVFAWISANMPEINDY